MLVPPLIEEERFILIAERTFCASSFDTFSFSEPDVSSDAASFSTSETSPEKERDATGILSVFRRLDR